VAKFLFLNNFKTLGRITFVFKECSEMSVTLFTPEESTSDMDWEQSNPDSSNPVLEIRNLSLILGQNEG
jgi:hypothetical protein